MGFDASVQLKLSSLRFVFLNRFIQELQTYVSEAQRMKELLLDVGSAAAVATKGAVENYVAEKQKCKEYFFFYTHCL